MAGATYVEVTLADIEDFLAECKRPPTRVSTRPHEERWYEWLLPEHQPGPQLTVRWYTSVVQVNGDVARGKGKDAMRVVVMRAPNTARERVVLSMTRVHRVAGWEERVFSRMTQAWKLVTKSPRCPACGARMSPRVTKKGRWFWSCTRDLKDCKGALPIRQKPPVQKPEEIELPPARSAPETVGVRA